MSKIIACIDGSPYAASVCQLAAWASKEIKDEKATSGPASISLFHVASPHQNKAEGSDLSGQITPSGKKKLLEKLTERDEDHGKAEQRKGRLILAEAKTSLAAYTDQEPDIIHRWGQFPEEIAELASDKDKVELVVMGKHGEISHSASDRAASHLECVARGIVQPLLIAVNTEEASSASHFNLKKVLIAYNGSEGAKRTVDFIANSPLFKDAIIHLLYAGKETDESKAILQEAENFFLSAGRSAIVSIFDASSVEEGVSAYAKEHQIDLLAIGAYHHLKIRSFFLGSMTNSLIKKSDIPVLLMR